MIHHSEETHQQLVERLPQATGRDLKDFPTEKLEGKRLAIIGYGNIGREMAKLAQAFGMEVRAWFSFLQAPWADGQTP